MRRPDIVGLPLPLVLTPPVGLRSRHGWMLSPDAMGAAALGLAPVIALGAADGGFFPRSWAWAALGLATPAIGVIVARREHHLLRRPLALLGVLVALGAWMAASLWWTRSVGLSVLELQRLLVYLAGVGLAALLVRAHTARALLGGVFCGTAGVAVWGLVAYLLTRETTPDTFQGSYLYRPLGYANAMAIASVMALILGLGIATESASRRVRVTISAALVPLASALALTGSRAGWAALVVGVAIAAALAPQRARMLTTWSWLALVPALAVLATAATGLTSSGIVGARADELGEWLLAALAVLTALAVAPALIATRARPDRANRASQRRWWIGLPVVGVAALVVLWVSRPLDLAGDRPIFWRVAAAEFGEHPLVGSGAGTYAQVWLERRPVDGSVRDAHSVIVEALSDLGAIGGVIVCVLLSLPLLWSLRARRRPLVPAAAGAFAAYAAHVSVDWDWEMPAITLAGLLCGVAIGVLADGDLRPTRLVRAPRRATVALAVAVAAAALAGLIGTSAMDDAHRSLARGDAVRAERAARRAQAWQPWSVEPRLVRGEASVALGDRRRARALFAEAAATDPNDYRAWLALAAVSRGSAAEAAVARARALNPRAIHGP